MAIVIESTSISDYVTGADIGSDTQFSITAPTGIQTGNLLLVYIQGERTARTVNLPSGFTEIALPSADSQVVKFAYKYAVLADESAGSYTFTVSGDDSAGARWAMYRLSGAQSSGSPAMYSDGATLTATSTSISESVDVQTQAGGLLFVFIPVNTTGASTVNGFSSLTLTGTTVSMTERFDSLGTPSAGTATSGALYDGIPTAGGTITNISFTYGDDANNDDTIYVSVVFIRAQQNGTHTASFYTTTNTAFASAGTADANGTVILATLSNTAFSPSGEATTPTRWTKINKS